MPLKLKRYKSRGSNWYLRGTVRGQVVFETTGTDNAKAAEAIRIKREAALLERSVFGRGATLTFLEAAVDYLDDGGEPQFLGTLDEETGEWNGLIGRFARTPIDRIDQAEIDLAARELYPSAKPATRKRQVHVPVSAVLKHSGRDFRIRHPKVKRAELKFSTPTRLEKLLPACSEDLRRAILFLVYEGPRVSELLRIDWERDMGLARRTATLRRTKNGEPRTVYLAGPVLEALSEIPVAERTGRVFKRWKTRHSLNQALERACARAGVEYLPSHQQGRHTCASWLRIYAGRDLRGLMEDLGWKDIHSTLPYMHLVPGETQAAIDKLPEVSSTPKSVASATRKRTSS